MILTHRYYILHFFLYHPFIMIIMSAYTLKNSSLNFFSANAYHIYTFLVGFLKLIF